LEKIAITLDIKTNSIHIFGSAGVQASIFLLKEKLKEKTIALNLLSKLKKKKITKTFENNQMILIIEVKKEYFLKKFTNKVKGE